ncbi:MAG TPA: ornithine cyclodeaminase family protein [Thermoanaerobaculia bacterium]|jgi:ornithine cyclodeaminase|nr:ornithine cyclodeaminase family protein [Thermoanaerobaculia bacterium]
MQVLVVSEHEVESILTMRECIAVMEQALTSLGRGEMHQPLRSIVRPPGAQSFLGLMPSYRGGATPFYALKEICLFPGNPARGLDTHLGAVLLHSGETGQLLAVINASAVTAIRTAAVSAVATRLLARHDAKKLAIIGAGVQARSHLEAIPLVRKIESIDVFSRTPEKIATLCGAGTPAGETPPGSAAPHVAESVEDAVREADIIVTATSSKEPVLRREWIKPGAHINAVGSSVATTRELDSATVAAASLFVDRRESTINESGDYLMALRDGAIKDDHIRAEIGEILIGAKPGRTSPDEITLFKSLGLAIEDLAAAAFIYEKVKRSGGGKFLEF